MPIELYYLHYHLISKPLKNGLFLFSYRDIKTGLKETIKTNPETINKIIENLK